MSTTVTIGYADGKPLEQAAEVDLLVDGIVAATGSPDSAGQIVFAIDPPTGAQLAVRFHASGCRREKKPDSCEPGWRFWP